MDEPDDSSGGGCGGYFVLTAAAAGVGAAVYAYSRDVFVIVFWALGAILVWRAARKMPATPDPAPPAPPERGPDATPQVTDTVLLRDPSHPNRWLITRPSRWLKADNDKTGTS